MPGWWAIPAGTGAAEAGGVLEFRVDVLFEVGLPVRLTAGMRSSAGPGPVNGAPDESGFDGVVFEVPEETLEAGGVKQLGVVAGVQFVGPWRR